MLPSQNKIPWCRFKFQIRAHIEFNNQFKVPNHPKHEHRFKWFAGWEENTVLIVRKQGYSSQFNGNFSQISSGDLVNEFALCRLPKTGALGRLSPDLVGFYGLKSFAQILPKIKKTMVKHE